MRKLLDLIRDDFQPRTFQIFEMSYLERRETKEIATHFGMKNSAVREARRRVMNRLTEESRTLIGTTFLDKLPSDR